MFWIVVWLGDGFGTLWTRGWVAGDVDGGGFFIALDDDIESFALERVLVGCREDFLEFRCRDGVVGDDSDGGMGIEVVQECEEVADVPFACQGEVSEQDHCVGDGGAIEVGDWLVGQDGVVE